MANDTSMYMVGASTSNHTKNSEAGYHPCTCGVLPKRHQRTDADSGGGYSGDDP
jgi:hypothetical protein